MKHLLPIFIAVISINISYTQDCAEFSSWTYLQDNGNGTCDYSVSVNVTSGNGASGNVIFTIDGNVVHLIPSCKCNPELATFDITVTCGSAIDIDVAYDAPGNGNDCSITLSNIVLPVEWISNDVRNDGESNIVNWTVHEINNHLYLIERSIDGINFETIGGVNSIDNNGAINSYHFEDTGPYPGLNYYRIKQIDVDGSYSFSKTMTMDNPRINEPLVFPNPFEDVIYIESDEKQSWKLIDSRGRLLLEGNDTKLDVESITPGIYYLISTNNFNHFFTQEIVKL